MPPPKDTIFARKILMGAIDMNMDEIETMLAPGGKLDDAEAQRASRYHLDHADGIPAHVPDGHQSMEARCRSRSCNRHVRIAGPVG